MTQLVDGIVRHTDDIEVDDGRVIGAIDQIDDARQEWLDRVTGHYQRPGRHPVGLGGVLSVMNPS